MFCYFDADGQVILAVEAKSLVEICGEEVLRVDEQLIPFDVISVDSPNHWDAVFNKGPQPGTRSAANINHTFGREQFHHDRHNHSGRPERIVYDKREKDRIIRRPHRATCFR